MNAKHLNRWSVWLLGAVLTGCGNPADKVAKATISADASGASSAAAASPAASLGEARSYIFGPENSTISFVGSKVTGHHDGGFKKFSGELKTQGNKLANTGNKVEIDTTSIWTDTDRLTGHLKTKDFFDVAQFPTSTFETVSISDNGTNSTVTGKLTLHGITKEISFPATIKVGPDSVDVDAQFAINRLDFDIKFKGMPNDLIRNDVVLKLKVRATPAKA
jgi:polyisoprenoid-binding protein YceI